jgi:hypothetical protein
LYLTKGSEGNTCALLGEVDLCDGASFIISVFLFLNNVKIQFDNGVLPQRGCLASFKF